LSCTHVVLGVLRPKVTDMKYFQAILLNFTLIGFGIYNPFVSLAKNPDSFRGCLVSVLNFGAKADGVTDDTEAFYKAIKFASGRTVDLEGKTYAVNLEFTTGNFKIDGQDATLVPANENKAVISLLPQKYLYDMFLSNIHIRGKNFKQDGIYLFNNSIEKGADFLSFENLVVTNCRYGLNVEGRSIWNKIRNCRFDWNVGGLRIETALPCNLWDLTVSTFNHNKGFGVWIKNLDAFNIGFKNFKFNSCNMEGNGSEVDQGYGCMFHGLEMLVLDNVYVEGNKGKKRGVGINITGPLGRAFVINGCWIGDSEFPLVIDGEKKWGTISNSMVDCSPYKTPYDIFLNTNWFNNEPKIIVSNVLGRINTKADNAGNGALKGVDWINNISNNEIDLQYRDWVKIFNDAGNQIIGTISGIHPGRRIGIINYTTKNLELTIKASLMFDGKDFVIKPNDVHEFLVDGYPTEGKLRPLK